MSTKTLLMTAVLGAASIAAVMAADPVYSVNIVGYVNVTAPAKFSMIANPLKSGGNTLAEIIPTAPDGTSIYLFGKTGFLDPVTYYVVPGIGAAWDAPDTVLAPGDGAFIYNGSGADMTLTFVGEVMTGALSTAIPQGWSIKSSQVPQQLDLTTLGFPAADGDAVYFFDSARQTYFDPHIYYVVPDVGADWDSPPIPKVGESFFVSKGAAASWTRTFTVQ